jgi:hypothetical protein
MDGDGNVGIGTTNPGDKLHIAGGNLVLGPVSASAGATGSIQFRELAATGTEYVGLKAPDSIAASKTYILPAAVGTVNQVLSLVTVATGELGWATNAASGMSNPLTVTGDLIYASDTAAPSTAARLGIGANDQCLVVVGGLPAWGTCTATGTAAGADKQIQFNNGGSAFGANSDFTWDNGATAKTLSVIGEIAGPKISLILRNSSTGNTASNELQINNDKVTSTFSILVNGDQIANAGNYVYIYNKQAAPLIFGTSNAERMRIDTGGNVGIGTTVVGSALLDIGTGTPTTAASGLMFGTDATANLYRISAGTIKTDGAFIAVGSITGAGGAFTTLTSSGATTLGTGASMTNTFGAGTGAINTFGASGGTNAINGSTTIIGTTLVNSTGTASTTIGNATGTLTLHGATTLDNTFSQTGANTFSTGTGAVSLNGETTIATGKGLTLTAGNITLSSGTINKITLTTPATGSTLTIVDGKTFTVNKTISLTSADDTGIYTLPTGTKTLVATDVASLASLATTGVITSGGLGTGAVIGGATITLGSDASYDMYYRGATGVLTNLATTARGVLTSNLSSVPTWTALTDGQIIVGSTAGSPSAGSITGTTNQITVTGGSNSITLSTPQNIHTGATPTFAGMTLSTTPATGVGDLYLCISEGGLVRKGATCDPSAERFKENITPLAHGLDWLTQFTPSTYIWKYNGSSGMSLIADNVADIDSQLAIYQDGQIYSLNDRAIQAVMVKAIQELDIKVELLSTTSNISTGTLGPLIKNFLENVGNGIQDFYANRVRTKELCLSDTSGETCITRAQLNVLMASVGGSGSASEQPAISAARSCTAPQTLIDGVCTDTVQIQEVPTCTDTQVLVDNVCTDLIEGTPTCTDTQTLVDNVCVDNTPPEILICTEPQILVDGACIEPTSETP